MQQDFKHHMEVKVLLHPVVSSTLFSKEIPYFLTVLGTTSSILGTETPQQVI
jgi:hypothetical protein